IFSFFGVVDLLAILPTYLMIFVPGAQRLAVVRSLRLLRAFRIFKLAHLLREATTLRRALWLSRAKISVFLAVVVIAVTIAGALMHLIEGPESGFTSIPESMYWAIVTMTTVGYGDIAPVTPLGKMVAAVMMMFGYSLIIVPTGIVSAELARAAVTTITTQVCPNCMRQGHESDATYCKYCGSEL
ncbi:MAG: ion transporter, partial [Pirellulales bacterium]